MVVPAWMPVKLNGVPPVPCRPPEPLLQMVPPGGVPLQAVAFAILMLSARAFDASNNKLQNTSSVGSRIRRNPQNAPISPLWLGHRPTCYSPQSPAQINPTLHVLSFPCDKR